MAFQKVKRSDSYLRDTASKISLRKEHIGYNAFFVKEANLNQYNRVEILIDPDEYKIGFQFLYQDPNTKDVEGKFKDTFACYSDSPDDNDVRTKATGAQKLYGQFEFLKKISMYTNPIHRQFKVQQDPNDASLWFAQLHPTFEHTVGPSADLKGLRGIYRYKNNDLIMYIGKGVIESRISAPQRAKWVYDTIEYSIINDPAKQFEWENFWIERYKEDHQGQRPLYNQIDGRGH